MPKRSKVTEEEPGVVGEVVGGWGRLAGQAGVETEVEHPLKLVEPLDVPGVELGDGHGMADPDPGFR
jgi:hypothetical protein